MAYRGKYPNRIASVGSMRDVRGAVIVTTNGGDRFTIYAKENSAPLRAGQMPALGDDIAIYNRHPATGAMVRATAVRPVKGKLCHIDPASGGFDVRLYQQGRDSFAVQYGFQVREGLTYGEAAAEYGACVMHALACEGLLDNREAGERRRCASTTSTASLPLRPAYA